jgi:hypothetical protein
VAPSKVVKPAGRPKPPNAGKGRKKGVPNKSTASVKEALALAFQGVGGVPALQTWAKDNPGEFYKLWSKMLPTEVQGSMTGTITVTFANE